MTTIPQLSVIFTTYNDSRFVAEALESMLSQTFTDFELIVADDASTDNTLEVVMRYNDPRIKIVRNKKNLGLAKNLNAALPHCRARLVARQDGDDASLPERFARQIAYLQRRPEVALVGTQDIWIDEAGNETARHWFPTDCEEIRECLKERNCFNHSSVMFRKEEIENVGMYRPFPGCEDYDLWVRVAALRPVANLTERLVLRRIREGSMSFDGIAAETASATLIQRLANQRFRDGTDELDSLDGPELERRIQELLRLERKSNRKLVASKNVELFHRILRSSGRRRALRYLVRAIRLDPLNPGTARIFLDNYVSRSVWPLLKTLRGRF
jgi:glycosyltransferase involved in cell wall biosynthesis